MILNKTEPASPGHTYGESGILFSNENCLKGDLDSTSFCLRVSLTTDSTSLLAIIYMFTSRDRLS